jgi:hypothetical protein
MHFERRILRPELWLLIASSQSHPSGIIKLSGSRGQNAKEALCECECEYKRVIAHLYVSIYPESKTTFTSLALFYFNFFFVE